MGLLDWIFGDNEDDDEDTQYVDSNNRGETHHSGILKNGSNCYYGDNDDPSLFGSGD
jgi:hypothetical protein